MDQESAIHEVVRRLADYYHQERISLFESAACGNARPDSDLDFLVVVPDSAPNELLLSGREYERLSGIPVPADVVPIRRSAFASRKDWLMALLAISLREGRLVDDADPTAA